MRDVGNEIDHTQMPKSSLPAESLMRELSKKKHRETRIHTGGNFLNQGEIVEGDVPSLFGKLADGSQQDRLGVAMWLMQADNPLTARVAINRVWVQLFGIGFVEMEEDLGTQGSLASHPALLDSLAIDFRDNGWSIKKLLKTIVMSSTYRQSAATTKQHLETDPRNRLLSRGPRFRLSAETVRDQALAESGLLTRQVGGPSVMTAQPGGVWKSTYSGKKWKNATGKRATQSTLRNHLVDDSR